MDLWSIIKHYVHALHVHQNDSLNSIYLNLTNSYVKTRKLAKIFKENEETA